MSDDYDKNGGRKDERSSPLSRLSQGKSRRTGFAVADEDVPVLLLDEEDTLQGNTVLLGEDSQLEILVDQPRSLPGPSGMSGIVENTVDLNIGHGSSYDEPSQISKKYSSDTKTYKSRSSSFSLNKDFDEDRLGALDKHGGKKNLHMAELVVGVVANLDEVTDPSNYENSSIFESFFDLTHARLLHIFRMFDDLSAEKEKGILNYENFQKSLRDAGLQVKDKASFERLVKRVDLDHDGGITFAEFETVVQSLKMAHMFRYRHKSSARDQPFRCINYNSARSEETLIQRSAFKTFMYAPRPEWSTCRWMDLTLPATFTLKCLSIKHRLHPLALEDALKDSRRMRAKVDRYDTHLFVAFPVLTLVYNNVGGEDHGEISPRSQSLGRRKRFGSSAGKAVSSSQAGGFSRYGSMSANEPLIRGVSALSSTMGRNRDTSRSFEGNSPTHYGRGMAGKNWLDDIQVPKVVKHNAFMFLSRPDNNTMVTVLNNECKGLFGRVRHELSVSYSRLRTHDGMYLLYTLLDVIVDSYCPLVDELQYIANVLWERVRSERRRVVSGKGEVAFTNAYHDMIRELNHLKRWMAPAMRVVGNLILEEDLAADVKIYLRDVHDHLEQTSDDINQLISNLQALKEEHDHAIDVKMNGTMNALTILATALLPAQFLSSVYGMNFTDLPELHWKYGYAMFWAMTFLSWALLYSYFRHKGFVEI